ncbi:hypothetical protein T4B_11645, partial [Trichinella pseudospiralis]
MDCSHWMLALEDILPDGESLEAALNEWRQLRKEAFTTRTRADTSLKEKDKCKESVVKPALTVKLGPQLQLGKLQPVPLPKFGDLGAITILLHLRSCLSGAELKAIEGITVCAENYPEIVRTLYNRFHRVPEVVERHVLKGVGFKECQEDGASNCIILQKYRSRNKHPEEE